MGVLNVTPDSFSDGGSLLEAGSLSLDKALHRVEQMLEQGAAIIDIGGESTRPGAELVSLQEEFDRVMPVVEAIKQRFDTIISVDTSSPKLMLAAAAAGAGLINDIRALERPGAIAAALQAGLPVCLMHMKGQPISMQQAPEYQQVVGDVSDYLQGRVDACLQAGLSSAQIILDPGFGFGKTVAHNLSLLRELSSLAALNYPLLVGLSRKSLIGALLGRAVDQRLAGSLTLAVLAVERGASIVRAHDVAETVDAMRLCAAVNHIK
ncbi:MAG: dihydropteroate synthase [Spongiibacteraceae bacterium]